jgi:hypothetical protein
MDTQQTFSDALSDLRPSQARLRPALIDAAAIQQLQRRLGRSIRRRRRMMDLTLHDLAGACGVSFQQVHKYEAGLCSLSAAQLWVIARALDVPVAYFYEGLTAPDAWRADNDDETLD